MPNKLIDRFISYVKKNTRSDENSNTIPSTKSQSIFLQELSEELRSIGYIDVKINPKNSFLTATIPSNTDKSVPTIGFIAHVDTADFNAENIRPQFHENYDGSDIILDKDNNVILSVEDFPNLNNYIGDTLITTGGDTLLGADDKAGVAEIVTAGAYLIEHPEIKHGKIRVAFGPDEEIGRGADFFDVKDFGCDFAYTVDGSVLGELQYECFNAAVAHIKIHGKNVHPGTAKDKMINSLEVARAFQNRIPLYCAPEYTQQKEGFYHLTDMNGTVEETEFTYIIRDFDKRLFEEKKNYIIKIAEEMNKSFGCNRIDVEIHDQYYNMIDVISKDLTCVEIAHKAMNNLGIEPVIEPIRGGTDGSKISFMGLPTPNLFTGAENFHGKYEFASVNVMKKALANIIEISTILCK